jgi:hypothetical protein
MNDETTNSGRAPSIGYKIRGRHKVELVQDIVDGIPYKDLAEKFGISYQGVVEFAKRHKPEIQAKRDGVAAELSWRWSTNREKKYAELETEVEEVEGEVNDPSLTPADRLRARNLKRQLIRDMNEMTGHLVTRSRVEVDTGPALTSEIVGFDPAEWMAELSESRRNPVPDSAPAAAAADEPEPESEPPGPG